ncbi:sensor histidine kinase [Halofilum ochraceum]|uniref:sensor histidine kinase n=1 Tax=Halofilum ochraceum TaxID=1611323 RepID=UPI0009F65D27|nr:ATP-binding protein [Halofilum ochraceum]
MVIRVIQRLATGFWPMVGLFVLLLLSLYVLGNFAQSYERFGRFYVLILFINIVGLAFIGLLVGVNIWNLTRQFRERAAGARLTGKLVTMFIVLTLVPVTIVFSFSLKFINSGIDSWFDVEVERALDDALTLSKESLGLQMRTLQRVTEQMAGRLDDVTNEQTVPLLSNIQAGSTANQLTLLSDGNRVIATSSDDMAQVVPVRPTPDILAQLRQNQPYIGLDPVRGAGLHVRVVVPVAAGSPGGDPRVLQALYPVPDEIDALAENVQAAVGKYRQLTYLREPLKTSYIGTLTLALGLSVLTAIWAAFYSARRLMLPIHNLGEGTRAVAQGNYATRLPPSGRDELGFLVESFNEMTRRLSDARDQTRLSRLEVESQRAYLEAVLERISTGVLTLDAEGALRTANAASTRILGVDLAPLSGQPLSGLAAEHAALGQFLNVVMPHVERGGGEWREEFELPGQRGRKIIVCRGTRLPDQQDLAGGWVVVFDDITALVQAQREAAWSEVARRLAHEIKNPLTPIQLSAERLRHRFLSTLPQEDAELLDRSTWTIVQQVEALKAMVRAFADYASTPAADFTVVDLNELVREVVDLYDTGDGARVMLSVDDPLPPIDADRSRLRQVLHNLIKNALEAQSAAESTGPVTVATRLLPADGHDGPAIELRVSDTGQGIPAQMITRLFEPYMTGKSRGSGLGLSIVRRIVEEHGGSIEAENRPEGGASIRIRLPARVAHTADGAIV